MAGVALYDTGGRCCHAIFIFGAPCVSGAAEDDGMGFFDEFQPDAGGAGMG